MQNEASVEIDRPIKEVFQLTNNHVAEWSSIVVEDDVIEEKPEMVGTTFRTVTEEKGNRMEFQGVITQYDPPHKSAIHMTGRMFDMDIQYRFEDLGGTTRITQTTDVKGKGFCKVIFFLFGWLMKKSSCKAGENEMDNLKTFCEQRRSPVSG